MFLSLIGVRRPHLLLRGRVLLPSLSKETCTDSSELILDEARRRQPRLVLVEVVEHALRKGVCLLTNNGVVVEAVDDCLAFVGKFIRRNDSCSALSSRLGINLS